MNDSQLIAELSAICSPERIAARLIDRLAYSRDASSYRMIPRAIVRPESLDEIRALFRWSIASDIPLTFRAAGTSLSGQAVTEGVIVEITRRWERVRITDGGRRVQVQPGIIAGRVNLQLKQFSAKIGPDPASINACTIGGILANNSSGMCCGVAQNSYHTVESLTFLLPDGTLINSADTDADAQLRKASPHIYDGILALKQEISGNPALCEVIRHKYLIKNTIGYSLNSFLDADSPAAILAKLMIGSEGTLGFIADAVFATIPDKPFKTTGMLYFPNVPAACRAIVPLRDSGAATLELMDRAALRSVEHLPGAPVILRSLRDNAAALLVEYQSVASDDLNRLEHNGFAVISSLELLAAPLFTHDTKEQAALWKIRKGMFPSVGAARASGTGIINEDVAFPIEHLAHAVADLQDIFRRFGYEQAIIFGHAKDGNLHFVLTQKFDSPDDIARYDALMQEVAELVIVKYGGSFKAEHGTGRNAAPFVEKEWGPELYDIMKRLKRLIDPHDILNRGIIINDDAMAHIRHVKLFPKIEDSVDKCIECGYCESHCPSRNLTLTPRQRIILRRERSALEAEGNHALTAELDNDYLYDGLETCATDGMCAVVCPVGINTGDLVKTLRQQHASPLAKKVAGFLARNFGTVQTSARLAVRTAKFAEKAVGSAALTSFSRIIRKMMLNTLPPWGKGMTSAPELPHTQSDGAEYVYFPSCVGRILGKNGEGELQSVVLELCRRANIRVFLPEESDGYCCGMPFTSKGFTEAGSIAGNALADALQRWTGGGRLPLITDANSCSQTLLHLEHKGSVRSMDVMEFAATVLLPRLSITKITRKAALHPTCSAVKTGIVPHLETIARACTTEILTPPSAGCCGFAGDRGLLVPELTASATEDEAREVRAAGCTHGYSGNIPCEIALSNATGIPYRSILFLLEEATRL